MKSFQDISRRGFSKLTSKQQDMFEFWPNFIQNSEDCRLYAWIELKIDKSYFTGHFLNFGEKQSFLPKAGNIAKLLWRKQIHTASRVSEAIWPHAFHSVSQRKRLALNSREMYLEKRSFLYTMHQTKEFDTILIGKISINGKSWFFSCSSTCFISFAVRSVDIFLFDQRLFIITVFLRHALFMGQ